MRNKWIALAIIVSLNVTAATSLKGADPQTKGDGASDSTHKTTGTIDKAASTTLRFPSEGQRAILFAACAGTLGVLATLVVMKMRRDEALGDD